jgi:hypothetical protein
MKIFKITLIYFSWFFLEIVSFYTWWEDGTILRTGDNVGAGIGLLFFNLALFGLLTIRIRNLIVFPKFGDNDYINIYIPSALVILCSILELVFLKYQKIILSGFVFDSKILLIIFIPAVIMGFSGTRNLYDGDIS